MNRGASKHSDHQYQLNYAERLDIFILTLFMERFMQMLDLRDHSKLWMRGHG